MPTSSALLAVFAASITAASTIGSNSPPWDLTALKSLVVFGDSYSDDSRLAYFSSHNGTAPPVGWVDPANYHAADGGRPWPQYIAQYAGALIYNYAVQGAVCSNAITPRLDTTFLFPDIAGYEVPAYIADSEYYLPNGTKFLIDDADSTVYAFWIGTNDLGVGAFLTDSQVNGTNIEDYLDCVYQQVDRVYANGGRYFVLMNVIPLNLTPLYGLPGKGGVGDNQYWTDKPSNWTAISYRMLEEVVGVDAVYKYRTPFEAQIARRYPGAKFAVYDVHSLFTDIYNNPSEYLNGTSPLTVTGYATNCNLTAAECDAPGRLDSFLWYDELHPSEQAERIVAREFLKVVEGVSSYAQYWSD